MILVNHFYIGSSRYVSSNIGINLGNGYFRDLPSNIRLEYADQLTSKDLYAGRLPSNDNEIIISYGIYSRGDFQGL